MTFWNFDMNESDLNPRSSPHFVSEIHEKTLFCSVRKSSKSKNLNYFYDDFAVSQF